MVGLQNSQESLERFHQALDVADTVLDFSKGVGSGMLTAGAETATGLIDAVLHPIDTAKGFAQAVLHLDILFDQAISSVVKVIDEYPEYSPEKKGEVVGEISFHVASAWFSMGFGKAGATATNLARAGKVEALAQGLEDTLSFSKKINIDFKKIDASRIANNPLRNTRYTQKVISQMRTGDYHSFPQEVDNFAGLGSKRSILGGDSITRTKIELNGAYAGKNGRFEWIIEPTGEVNHRLFVPEK
jgi:hypothetical protein